MTWTLQTRDYWRLSAYYFCYFAFIGAYAPYFSLYLESLAFSAWQIGVLMSLMQVMRMFAPYLGSRWADRVGRRTPIVAISALASLAGFAVFLVTSDFAAMFCAMAVLAFFWGAALPLVESLTLGHLGAEQGHYGRIRLWGSIGFILAALVLGYLLDRLPIRVMLWAALLALLGIFAFSLVLRESPVAGQVRDGTRFSALLVRREVIALLSACFTMSAAHGALYVFLSIHLADLDYDRSAIGWLWTLGVAAEIVVFYFLPATLRHLSLRKVLMASLAIAVLRFLLIGWAAQLLWVIVLAQVMHGATFGAYHAAAVAAVNRWFAGRHQAYGQALYSSVSFGAGGMFGGLLAGFSWDALGPALTFSISALLALAGLAAVWRGWPQEPPVAR